MFELETTKSWDALGLTLKMQQPNADDHIDIIIGMVDSGICPKSMSFVADGIKPPPSSWKGDQSNDPKFTCTNKIVGAQTYTIMDVSKQPGYESIRDYCGHGTQCAAIAAGNPVRVSLDGFRKGTARGGLPKARIAVYKVMTSFDTHEAFNIYEAIKKAVNDGVDILSIPIGKRKIVNHGVTNKRKIVDYFQNEIPMGTFYAMKAGILCCVSSGNYKENGTVGNVGAWEICCAASTSRKTFTTTVVLGKGIERIKGSSLNTFHDTQLRPLIYSTSAKKKKVVASSENIDSGVNGSLDKSKVKGKIVVYKFRTNGKFAFEAGASGIIVICKDNELPYCRTFPLPAVYVTKIDGDKIIKYIEEELLQKRVPEGRIFRSVEVANQNYPCLARFSSKGPNKVSPFILKPDICAPGVEILTATSSDVPGEKRVNPYTIVSGTSMATGTVAGGAAYVKSKHRNWSPAAIKSALMTTASSMKIKSSFDVLGIGSGLMNPIKAIDPGLIYDISPQEYQDFLDAHNKVTELSPVNEETLRLNLPSFAACLPYAGSTITFHRKVKHVGRQPTINYHASVSKLESLEVEVKPYLLNFNTDQNKEIPFEVTLTLKDWSKYEDGVLATSLEWKSSHYSVKSPIVIVRTLQL